MSDQFSITRLETTDSTNNYATILVNEKKAVDRQVILTKFQSHGRGQNNNIWQSQHGLNLTFSLILFPKYLKSSEQFYLSMCISLAVVDFLTLFHINIKIKWPNDIYVNNKKISGILIENSMIGHSFYHSVIGIGLNINQIEFDPSLPNPTSLFLETGIKNELDPLLQLLLNSIADRLTELENRNFAKLTDEYISFLYKLNEESEFIVKNEHIKATIKAVGEHGQLIIKNADGNFQNFLFKEIEYVL